MTSRRRPGTAVRAWWILEQPRCINRYTKRKVLAWLMQQKWEAAPLPRQHADRARRQRGARRQMRWAHLRALYPLLLLDEELRVLECRTCLGLPRRKLDQVGALRRRPAGFF